MRRQWRVQPRCGGDHILTVGIGGPHDLAGGLGPAPPCRLGASWIAADVQAAVTPQGRRDRRRAHNRAHCGTEARSPWPPNITSVKLLKRPATGSEITKGDVGQQTAIMGQQATISQRQLGIMAAEQRPWISVEDASIIVPLRGNPEESISTCSCPLKITAIRPQFTFGHKWRHWFGVRILVPRKNEFALLTIQTVTGVG